MSAITAEESRALLETLTGYTQAPWEWRIEESDPEWGRTYSLAPGILLPDGSDGTPEGDDKDRANARLIAAAPDLATHLRAALDREAAMKARADRADSAIEDAEFSRAVAAFYGNHTWLMRSMIEAAGELPRLEDGPFKEGFKAGVEEAMARADATAPEGGHQLQDAWTQIAALMSGHAILVNVPDGVTAADWADVIDPQHKQRADDALERAEHAEAERDAAQAQVERLRRLALKALASGLPDIVAEAARAALGQEPGA